MSVLRDSLTLFHRSGRPGKMIPCPGHPPDILWCELCESVDAFNVFGGASVALSTDHQEGTYSVALTIPSDGAGAYIDLATPVPYNSGFILGLWLKQTKVANGQELDVMIKKSDYVTMSQFRAKINYTLNNFIMNTIGMRNHESGCVTWYSKTLNTGRTGAAAWHWCELMHPELPTQRIRVYYDGFDMGNSDYYVCRLGVYRIQFVGRYQSPVTWYLDYIRLAPKSYGREYPPT